MKVFYRAIVVIILLFIPLSLAAQRESIRIMTFNIPYDNITAVGINTWANRCNGIINFLNETKPDLIGMQEAKRHMLVSFLKGMSGYAMIGRARDDGEESGEYSPILYRTDKFYVERQGTYWLTSTPDSVGKEWDSAYPRIATWGVFRDKQTGARFLYTNTHLDHKGSTARINQMCVIKEQMYEIYTAEGNIPALLTGDLNVDVSNTTVHSKAKSYKFKMNDAWTTATVQSGDGTTFEEKKLDYIYITPEITSQAAVIHESALPSGQILSDHDAHYADVTWEVSDSERAAALIREARAAIDSVYIYKSAGTKLITNATNGDERNQLYCDGISATEGQLYSYLIDGSTDTYFHSQDTSPLPPNSPHFLQADLLTDTIGAIHFTYARRNHNTYGIADRWQDVLVTASNDKETWEYITEFYDFGGSDMKLYESPTIVLPNRYRYIRFSIMHTPAENLRNAHPQFSASEFQIYPDTIDLSSSPAIYDNATKGACNALQNEINATLADTSTEQTTKLADALANLRNVKADKSKLTALIAEKDSLSTRFTTGSTYTKSTLAAMTKLKSEIRSVKTLCDSMIMPTKSNIDSVASYMQQIIDTFRTSIKGITPNVWYYIYCSGNTSYNSPKGNFLCAFGNNSTSLMSHTQTNAQGNKLDNGTDPYAMWRLVSFATSDSTVAYALQNRATGFYLGVLGCNGNYAMSTMPVALTMEPYANNDFHISLSNTEDAYVSASISGNEIVNSSAGKLSQASWMIKEVHDDILGKITIPIRDNSIQIMCLPYAVNDLESLNPTARTYTLNGISNNTVLLSEKTDFAPGEPFILTVGDCNMFDEETSDTISLAILPPDSLTATVSEINGMLGFLDQSDSPKPACFYFNNSKLVYASNVAKGGFDGHSGCILKRKVHAAELKTDATVTSDEFVNGISNITTDNTTETADIYTTDGILVLKNARVDNFPQLLPNGGIYVIKGNKLLIR